MKKILLATLLFIGGSAALADQSTILSLSEALAGRVVPSSFVSDHPAGAININDKSTYKTYYAEMVSLQGEVMTGLARVQQTENEKAPLVYGEHYQINLAIGNMINSTGQACDVPDCTAPEQGYDVVRVSPQVTPYLFQVQYLGVCQSQGGQFTKVWNIEKNYSYVNPDSLAVEKTALLAGGEFPSVSNDNWPEGTCQVTSDGGMIVYESDQPNAAEHIISTCGQPVEDVSGVSVFSKGTCTTQPQLTQPQ